MYGHWSGQTPTDPPNRAGPPNLGPKMQTCDPTKESQHERDQNQMSDQHKRLTEDKIITTKIKRDKTLIRKVGSTWEALLKKTWELPNEQIQNREFLVGMRA